MFKEMSRLYGEDCFAGINNLADAYGQFADVVITSPPYANQRKNQYGGVNEEEYPQWMVKVGESIKKILKPEGSAFINIRPHIKNGEISDYVLKTRLALREAGWKECEELIWVKPDSPPLGSINRPRRAWESILWFSPTNKPYCNPKANGTESNRIGFENNKFEHGGKSHLHAGQNKATKGVARVKDYIEVGTSKVEKEIGHPAMFPVEIPEYLIHLACPENGMVVDPFGGSCTVARAAINLDRGFTCFEISDDNFEEAVRITKRHIVKKGKANVYEDFMELADTILDELLAQKGENFCSVCNSRHLTPKFYPTNSKLSAEKNCIGSRKETIQNLKAEEKYNYDNYLYFSWYPDSYEDPNIYLDKRREKELRVDEETKKLNEILAKLTVNQDECRPLAN